MQFDLMPSDCTVYTTATVTSVRNRSTVTGVGNPFCSVKFECF